MSHSRESDTLRCPVCVSLSARVSRSEAPDVEQPDVKLHILLADRFHSRAEPLSPLSTPPRNWLTPIRNSIFPHSVPTPQDSKSVADFWSAHLSEYLRAGFEKLIIFPVSSSMIVVEAKHHSAAGSEDRDR